MSGSLKLYLTDDYPNNCCPTASYQFSTNKKPEWFNDIFVQKVLREIDGAEVLFEEALKDRYGHGISTEMVSSTSKYTILMYFFPEWTFITAAFGENAWPLICEILNSGKSLTMLVNSHIYAHNILNKGFKVYMDDVLVTDDTTFYNKLSTYFDAVSEEMRELDYDMATEEGL